MIRVLLLIVGYAFGLIQTGYIYGRITNKDLRSMGSGNTGATNALRSLGVKAGLIIFLIDALKAFVACFAVRMIFREDPCQFAYVAYTGVGVLLGNNYPFYLKFKGGKGMAALAGFALAVDYRIFVIGLPIFILIVVLSKYVSLASIIMSAFVAAFAIVMTFIGWIPIEGIPRIEFMVLMSLSSILIIIRHRSNIKRLLNGTENRFSAKKEKK